MGKKLAEAHIEAAASGGNKEKINSSKSSPKVSLSCDAMEDIIVPAAAMDHVKGTRDIGEVTAKKKRGLGGRRTMTEMEETSATALEGFNMSSTQLQHYHLLMCLERIAVSALL